MNKRIPFIEDQCELWKKRAPTGKAGALDQPSDRYFSNVIFFTRLWPSVVRR